MREVKEPEEWRGLFFSPHEEDWDSEENRREIRAYTLKAFDAYESPETPPETLENIWDTLTETTGLLPALIETAQGEMDVVNPDKFNRTAKILEFVAKIFANATEEQLFEAYVNAEHRPDPSKFGGVKEFPEYWKMKNLLETLINQEKGNYFLTARARTMLDLIDNETIYEEKVAIMGRSHGLDFFFEISPGQIGYYWNEKLYIVDQNRIPNATELVREHRTTTKEIEEKSRQAVKEYGSYTWPLVESRRLGDIEEQIMAVSHPINSGDLGISFPTGGNMSENDIQDFGYLTRYMRTKISEDFGVDLSRLPTREQFFFLEFIKYSTAEKMPSVRSFIDRFGTAGLRTFLALDYGRELGDKIIEIGQLGEQAEWIFERYADLLDLANKLKTKIDESEAMAQAHLPEELRRDFSGALAEAITRRSKDLLMAAHVIGVEKRETDLTIKDLLNALDALKLFLEIMNDMGEEEVYSFDPIPDNNTLKFNVSDDTMTTYELKIFIRPEATTKDGQARVNFELSFDTDHPNQVMQEAFKQTTTYHRKGKRPEEKIEDRRESSALRIGIDRETFDGEEDARVSLDLGRDRRDRPNFSRSGDPLGNLMSLSEGHHTFESFDSRYGDPLIFGEIATALNRYLVELMGVENPGIAQAA